MYFFEHLSGLIIAAWMVWLPGWWLDSRFELTSALGSRSQTPPVLTRFCAGLALWVAALFGLAAAQLFNALAFGGVALLWHALAFWERRRRGIGPPTPRPRWGSDLRSSFFSTAAALLVLGPVFALALTPTVSWDADVYHLTLPKLYLEHGGFLPIEMNVYSHWPQGLELLFGVAMAWHGYVLAKVLHFGCGLLVLLALIRLSPGRSGWLAAALFLLNDVVLFEMRVAYIDLAYAFALLLGASFAADATRGASGTAEDRRSLVLTGTAAGLLMGLKVTGLVSAAILALLLAPHWWRSLSRSGWRMTTKSVAAFALPCCLLGAPWWIKTWILTGNPIYPWMWKLFGGPDWSPQLAEQFGRWQQGIGMGRGWDDFLLLPWRVIVEGGRGYDRFDGEISLFWLAAVPLALAGLRSTVTGHRRWRLFGLTALLHSIFWALSSQQMRFLIPVLALFAVPAAAAAHAATRRFFEASPSRRRLAWVGGTVVFLAVAVTQHTKVLSGGAQVMPRFLHPTERPQTRIPEIMAAVDQLPADARLLFLNTNQGFFCPRPYLADSFFEASQITEWLRPATSPAAVAELLRGRSITHILYRHSEQGGLPYPQPLFDLLNDPRAAERIAFDGQFLVLALRTDPSSVDSP
ncbi:MAG: phospholipid carrier-dependent glycosyltransferase [Acidobacteriota bacterium]